jgi:hypothetical protein
MHTNPEVISDGSWGNDVCVYVKMDLWSERHLGRVDVGAWK